MLPTQTSEPNVKQGRLPAKAQLGKGEIDALKPELSRKADYNWWARHRYSFWNML